MSVYPFPDKNTFLASIGLSAAAPGFYGDDMAGSVVLTGNHLSSLVTLGEQLPESIGALVLQTGGYNVDEAAALGFRVDRSGLLNGLSSASNAGGTLLVPHSFSKMLGWSGEEEWESWRIVVIEDSLADVLSPGAGKKKETSVAIAVRLKILLRVWMTQFLIFLIPLYLFSWDSVLYGSIGLALAGLVLALLWDVLPGAGAIKGLIVGVILGAGWGVWGVLAGMVVLTLTLQVLAVLLLGIWMGVVLSGIKG